MLTYKAAGVDIEATTAVKKRIARMVKSTFSPAVLSDIGLFGSLYELKGYRDPVLVGSCDGVGTKLMVARMMNRHDTVGQDLVNHCVNDILTLGAKPLFFLDYIAYASLPPNAVPQVVAGLARACRRNGCALIGGETAMMPGLYPKDDYDLAGFIVGVVEKRDIISPKRIHPGDIVLGFPSTGLHTNGYSLARKVLFGRMKLAVTDPLPAGFKPQAPSPKPRQDLGARGDGRATVGDVLLRVHRSYLEALSPFLKEVKALAHITGGGLKDNIERLLPGNVNCLIYKDAWKPPPIFRAIQQGGGVSEGEMYHVFNMGIGMVVFADDRVAERILARRSEAKVIGEVAAGKGLVTLV